MRTVKLALVGYGNVGRAFVQMLGKRRAYLAEHCDSEVCITAVCTRSRGALVSPGGLTPTEIAQGPYQKGCTAFDVIDGAEYDVMVELTPINIRTGQPHRPHPPCVPAGEARHHRQQGAHRLGLPGAQGAGPEASCPVLP